MNWKLCQSKLLDEAGNEVEGDLQWQTLFVGTLEQTYDLASEMGYWGCKLRDFRTDTNSCSCQIDDYLLKIERC